MHALSSTSSFELRPGETAPLRIARQACLTIKNATVWLTREGEPTEHWLTDGQSFPVQAQDALWLSNDGTQAAVVEIHQEGPLAMRASPWLWRPMARGTRA